MLNSDINLRLEIDNDYARLTAWSEGFEEPAPQVSARLPSIFRPQDHEGRVTIWASSLGTPVPVAFRFVRVVPEPATSLLAALGFMGLTSWRRRVRM